MRLAIILSVVLHVGVLVWLFGPFTTPRPVPKFQEKPVTVGIVTASDFSRMKKGLSTAKKSEAQGGLASKPVKKRVQRKKQSKKPPVRKAKKAVLPPPPSKKAVRAPAVRPVPEKVKKTHKRKPKKVVKVKKAAKPVIKRKPKRKKSVERKPRHKPKPKSRPHRKVVKKVKKKVVKKVARQQTRPAARKKSKPKRFDPDNIAALLNKLPDADPVPSKVTHTPRAPGKPVSRPKDPYERRAVYGRRSGQDLKVTASELDAFKAKISKCWSPPTGGMGAGRMIIRLRLSFRRDGSLANPPRLLNPSSSPVFQAVADSAIRAVWQCQKYNLPTDKFATWREMVLNFDPREMYGG